MRPIVLLEHSPEVPPGYIADAIAGAGLPAATVRLHDGRPLPRLSNVSAIVSLGGIMGAYAEAEYPFLAEEKTLLVDAVAHDVPVLGLCLGCQMLADALGGEAFPAPRPEVEFTGLSLTAAGREDRVVRWLGQRVVSFHEDTWEPPPGAEVLANSRSYPHAFRLGSAVGIQSHPEASVSVVRVWVDLWGTARLEGLGVDIAALLASIDRAEPASRARAGSLFRGWLAEVSAATT